MFRKRDLIMIAVVLCVALILFGVALLTRSGQTLSGNVEIYIGGTFYTSVPLGETRKISVGQDNGYLNIVEVDETGARMVFASCKNQLCLQQGEVTIDNWTRRSLGRSIICLPNQVTIVLALENANQILIDEDLPDV